MNLEKGYFPICEDEMALGDCSVANEFGTCEGQVQCVDGVEACDAPIPKAEVCDGVDNDCNGEADEGFPDDNGDGIPNCLEEDQDEDKRMLARTGGDGTVAERQAILDTDMDETEPQDQAEAPADKEMQPEAVRRNTDRLL